MKPILLRKELFFFKANVWRMCVLTFTVIVCSVLTASPQIVFDDGKPPAKQRSPELAALDFMTGKWTSEFILRETPESKEFKGKGIGITKWSPNGQFLISDGWTLMAAPPGFTFNAWVNQLSVTTWDPIKKEYDVTEITAGVVNTLVMTMDRKGWTVKGETRSGDHITKTTMKFERISDTEMKVHTDCSLDGGPTWIFLEGSAKRISD